MNHLIVGAGVVGTSTGQFLTAKGDEVWYDDINSHKLKNLRVHDKKNQYNIIWICTHEKDVEDVLKKIKPNTRSRIIIRSTTPPGTVKALGEKYEIDLIGHNPEFLRETNKLGDTFFPDRIVIGTTNNYVRDDLIKVYGSCNCPIILTGPTTSEIIKLVSNCWLSTQISYWNEVKKLCDKLNINGQDVAYASTLDKRISKYGTAMTGKPFDGHCLPKDIDSFIKTFEDLKISSVLLKAVKEVNSER